MMHSRRSIALRCMALLFLIGSPGLGGVGLQALHTCAERMPWLADQTADAGGDSHHHGAHDPDNAGSPDAPDGHDCQCIGHCQAGAASTPQHTEVLAAVRVVPRGSPGLTAASVVAQPARESHRYPPATAPPLS